MYGDQAWHPRGWLCYFLYDPEILQPLELLLLFQSYRNFSWGCTTGSAFSSTSNLYCPLSFPVPWKTSGYFFTSSFFVRWLLTNDWLVLGLSWLDCLQGHYIVVLHSDEIHFLNCGISQYWGAFISIHNHEVNIIFVKRSLDSLMPVCTDPRSLLSCCCTSLGPFLLSLISSCRLIDQLELHCRSLRYLAGTLQVFLPHGT